MWTLFFLKRCYFNYNEGIVILLRMNICSERSIGTKSSIWPLLFAPDDKKSDVLKINGIFLLRPIQFWF